MAIQDFLFGKPEVNKQLPIRSPQQIARSESIGMNALQGLQGYNPQQFNFAPIEAQTRKNFETKGIPSILQRFASLGQNPNSSAFRSDITNATSDLESQLAAMQQQYNMQQQGYDLQRQGQLAGLFGLSQQPNFENIYRPETSGLLGGAGQGVGLGLGYGLTSLLGSLGSSGTASAGLGTVGATGAGAAGTGLMASLGASAPWTIPATLGGLALMNYLRSGR